MLHVSGIERLRQNPSSKEKISLPTQSNGGLCYEVWYILSVWMQVNNWTNKTLFAYQEKNNTKALVSSDCCLSEKISWLGFTVNVQHTSISTLLCVGNS